MLTRRRALLASLALASALAGGCAAPVAEVDDASGDESTSEGALTGFASVGNGVSYTRAGTGEGVLILYGGYTAQLGWVQGWASALHSSKLQSLGVGHVYAVQGPRDAGYGGREIGNTKLGAHLRANAPNATFVLVAAHSSGTYVAQELIGQIARSGDASTWLGKMVYANLDGGYGLEAATARQMRKAVFVWGDDPRAGQSSNAEVMKSLGGQYGAKGKTVRVDASGSGCNRAAKWCLHDTVITSRPHNPAMYDLANDYVKFAGDRKVVTSWIEAVEGDLR